MLYDVCLMSSGSSTSRSSIFVEPAVYFPFERGEYRVEAGLRPMGTDFGNGSMDGRVFQIDREYGRFLENVAGARAEDLDKYYVREPVCPV